MIVCAVFLIILIGIISAYFTGMYFFADDANQLMLLVNPREVIFETDQKFLSVALDISFMRCLFHTFSDKEWQKLEKLSRLLAPAYLRFGGTDADRTSFNVNADSSVLARNSCVDDSSGEIVITGKDWLKINQFARKSRLDLIVDLNVLPRKGAQWDSSNAEAIIKFSEENDLPLDFQLGNEPNSFPHVFNKALPASQLAMDYSKLRTLLAATKLYRESKLIGPEVTRPRHLGETGLKYLEEFLSKGVSVDVASWHQYYLDGRTAALEDFLNPETFNVFPEQIKSVSKVVREHSKSVPIWISETSSAFGGGAPHLSNRFVASFLWLDKLGIAAKYGMSVVVRQSLFKSEYALISEQLIPRPDFWISYFYKNAVGSKVLSMTTKYIKENMDHLRFYCHCARNNSRIGGNIVIFGMNLGNHTELIMTSGLSVIYPVREYIFRAEFDNLKAETVLLNSKPLVPNETTFDDMIGMGSETVFPFRLTSHSIGFWVIQDNQVENCCVT